MSPLRDFLQSNTDEVTVEIDGRAVPEARATTRRLDSLGVLSPQMLAEIIGSVEVDPFSFLTTARLFKDEIGLRTEEKVLGSSVILQSKETYNGNGHPARTIEINLFSNDITSAKYTVNDNMPEAGVKIVSAIRGLTLWGQLCETQKGKARLNAYKEYMRGLLVLS